MVGIQSPGTRSLRGMLRFEMVLLLGQCVTYLNVSYPSAANEVHKSSSIFDTLMSFAERKRGSSMCENIRYNSSLCVPPERSINS